MDAESHTISTVIKTLCWSLTSELIRPQNAKRQVSLLAVLLTSLNSNVSLLKGARQLVFTGVSNVNMLSFHRQFQRVYAKFQSRRVASLFYGVLTKLLIGDCNVWLREPVAEQMVAV